MGVSNITGANTLFIAAAALVVTAAFLMYRSIIGTRDDGECDNQLVRRNAWYAVDISMILNAMTRGRATTNIMRMQQCVPPMPVKQEVYDYMDSWYVQ